MGHHVWCGGDVDERLWGVSDTGILRLGLGGQGSTHLIVIYFFLALGAEVLEPTHSGRGQEGLPAPYDHHGLLDHHGGRSLIVIKF